MKKVTTSFLMFFALAFASFARIGETMDQCTARYGTLTQDASDPLSFYAVYSGFIILATFNDGICEAIAYRKQNENSLGQPEEISPNEMEILVKNNFGDAPFKKENAGAEIRFSSKDSTLGATYRVVDRLLIVMTQAAVDRINAATHAKEAEAMKGL